MRPRNEQDTCEKEKYSFHAAPAPKLEVFIKERWRTDHAATRYEVNAANGNPITSLPLEQPPRTLEDILACTHTPFPERSTYLVSYANSHGVRVVEKVAETHRCYRSKAPENRLMGPVSR
jgi:predicted metalloenzyme YecM